MPVVELKDKVYWVGAVDWNIREFHGYSTYKGTSYNAFLVLDEKKVLFDTVKKPFCNELVSRIREIIDPSEIDYLVVNHAEMDHTGALPEIMEIIKPEKLICSKACKKALIDHFHREDWPYHEVTSGQSISLGSRSVHFLETKMLHWPDSMFSYIPEQRLLISSDAFGQHWATSDRFEDEVDFPELMRHAAKYYANILLPFSPLVQKLFEEVRRLNLVFDMIATDHGLIWRSKAGSIIEAYESWSRQHLKNEALVIYDTMWNSTDMMAREIMEGLIAGGVSAKLLNLKDNHRSEIMTEALAAKSLIFGSPTLNNGMLPTMQDMLSYMKGLKPAGRVGASFGSYGWSGEAVSQMRDIMEQMKIKFIEPSIKVKYVPRKTDLNACNELGRNVAAAMKEEMAAV
ncbi:MAG: FprA family A-type flavoprotein [Candidatus Xenobiia bacterium LiM19]